MKELLLKLVASDRKHLDGALLFLRLFIGGMMLSQGWAKLASFSTLSATFPDPVQIPRIYFENNNRHIHRKAKIPGNSSAYI